MAAISQISKPATPGRVYYDKKLAEGKTGKEALRALKRRISDTIYRHLVGRPAAGQEISRGHPGTSLSLAWPASHPEHRLFSTATPGHPQTYTRADNTGPVQRATTPRLIDTKRHRYVPMFDCPTVDGYSAVSHNGPMSEEPTLENLNRRLSEI